MQTHEQIQTCNERPFGRVYPAIKSCNPSQNYGEKFRAATHIWYFQSHDANCSWQYKDSTFLPQIIDTTT